MVESCRKPSKHHFNLSSWQESQTLSRLNCLFTCKSEELKTYLVSEVEFPSSGIHGRLDTLGSQATSLQEIDEVITIHGANRHRRNKNLWIELNWCNGSHTCSVHAQVRGSKFALHCGYPKQCPLQTCWFNPLKISPPQKKSRRLRRSGHLNRRIDGRAPISVFSGRKGLSQTSMRRRRFVFC